MEANLIAVLAALPYAVVPLVTTFRVRTSRHLDGESGAAPPDAPLVSVVIPARNEELNIERCVRSVLSADYPRLEVIVVDDHSDDRTGEIARALAAEDDRLRVIDNAPLPDGWFGKQWACRTGAEESRGPIILFADADTVHSSDLITRSVNAMRRRGADLFTVAGRQEIVTFWEKLVQPQVFELMAIRFGGSEAMTRSKRVSSKIANGQCIFVRRDVYDELGGHALVKSHVADDMMMARRFFTAGKSVVAMLGMNQLSTRMYRSLGELVRGWGKNVFSAGIDSAPFGALGRFLFPVMLPLAPLLRVIPALVLVVAIFAGVPAPLVIWAAFAQACLLVWWIFIYTVIDESPVYALLVPIGGVVVFWIFLRAVLRGKRVSWKGREYTSGA
ncbi:MAG: glycosyltransferase [Gemmatimonadaceae bacterium]